MDIIIPATKKPQVTEVVERLIRHNSINTIIVIDTSPDTPSLREDIISSKIQRVYIKNQKYFNKSISINVAASISRSDWVIFCDADVILEDEFIRMNEKIRNGNNSRRNIISPTYVREREDRSKREAPGICGISKIQFLELNGYSSDFTGWGMEDRDFLHRAKQIGINQIVYSYGEHISHDDQERTQCYKGHSLEDMRRLNKAIFKKKVMNNETLGSYMYDIEHTKCCVYEKR